MEFPRETAVIKFDQDTLWHGLEVELYIDTPMTFFVWVRDSVDKLQEAEDDNRQLDTMIEFFVKFGDEVLKSWNIQKQSADVLPTGQGLATLSLKFGIALMSAWTRAVSETPAPLAPPSENGSSSAEALALPVSRTKSRGSSKKPGSSRGSARRTGASPPS